jgi:hypothetical protein
VLFLFFILAVEGTIQLYFQVYFHVIARDYTLEGGNVPQYQIYDQIDVLNNLYAGTGLSFVLRNIDYTLNGDWFDNTYIDYRQPQYDMKSQLRVGNVATLNVYTVGFTNAPNQFLIGYATFPWEVAGDFYNDGVVIRYSTLPGGTYAEYNTGKVC